MKHYILIGQTPVEEPDLLTWARWFEESDRRVFLTKLPWCSVSTVFLGLDHSFTFGEPVLFETMVFWDGDGWEQDRCHTWMQAEGMHAQMVASVSKWSAIWAWLKRLPHEIRREARDDWDEAWRDLNGIEDSVMQNFVRRIRSWKK